MINQVKPKIGIDIDDVLIDTISNFILFCKEKGFDIKDQSDFNNYYFCESKGINITNRWDLFTEFTKHILGEEIDFVSGAKNFLKELKKEFDICLISSRPTETRGKINKFIINNFGEDFFTNILYSGVFRGIEKSKEDICLENNIFILIEDRRKYALGCAREGIKVFLIDKPWNRENCEHENIIRVKNWSEILEKLK